MSIRGFGLTTDTQLLKLAQQMGIDLAFVGFAEELPRKPRGFNIINLGNSAIGGTHWTLWYVDPRKELNLYIDSYGVPPEDQIIRLGGDVDTWYNEKQVQQLEEPYCGIWALVFASVIQHASDKKKAIIAFLDTLRPVR